MTTTYAGSGADIQIEQLAQAAVTKYQQQQRGGTPIMAGQQLSAEEQARFLGNVGKWFADNVLPVALPLVTNLLTGQQRALGIAETRGGDEEQRFLLDFAKKALQLVAPVAQQALQGLLAPRQRDINEDAATTDRFAFLAPFIPALISAAGTALGGLLGGRRGPLTLDAEQDRLILSQFTTNCWGSLLRPEVLNSVTPILGSVQRPSTPPQAGTPTQPGPGGRF
jgi:hypothetical protein